MDVEEYRTVKDILTELTLIRVLLQRQNEMSAEAQRVLKKFDTDGMPGNKEVK